MAWISRRRSRAVFVIFVVFGFTVVCLNAQTITGYFGKGTPEVCEGDICKDDGRRDSHSLPSDTDASDGHHHGHVSTVNKEGQLKRTQDSPKSPVVKKGDRPSDDVTKNSGTDRNGEIFVIITFTNAKHKMDLQNKFRQTVSSMLAYASVPLSIQVIGDHTSQEIARGILKEASAQANTTYTLTSLDVDSLAKQVDEIVRPMQDHFSYKPGAYYNHALFFLSIGIHKVMPKDLHKVIMLDADLKFQADIKELYDRFDMFTDTNILGIGHDLQPVYRHTFWSYRSKHKGTRVGEPPPNGLTGFNSGVLLLDLDRMRKSSLYNSLLNRESLEHLTKEFEFKGHLGDQDFFTLLSMKYEELFHVLPCNWNRQLCQWWKDKGYQEIFDQYYNCEGDVKIYHGNCNTPIPDD